MTLFPSYLNFFFSANNADVSGFSNITCVVFDRTFAFEKHLYFISTKLIAVEAALEG